MNFNLITEGLAMQAMSIGKGPKEFAATQGNGITGADTSPSSASASAADHTENKPASQPLDYHEPIANVCPSCGRKHFGRFQLCLSCSQKD
jgi:hypothetical protein